MKKILIIGGSRGIGKELALLLAQNHRVLLLSRDLDTLEFLQKSTNHQLLIGGIDLTTPNFKEVLEGQIRTHLSEVDILINNAGYLVNKPILEITESDLKKTFDTNILGLILACQGTIPFMKNGGHIVNIGSMGGFQGSAKFPGLSIYSASKAAVAGFSECLAEELKSANIQVNCLALGSAQTEMLEEAFPGYKATVTAQEMATFIADFSLNANKWINGKVIPVSSSTP